VVVDEGEDGKPVVSTLQYETIGLLGSNLGIGTLDEIAYLNRLCNDFGLDSIEAGAALGVAAEAGLASFGDKDSFVSLLEEIAAGSVLGRVLGQGAAVTGRVLGVSRVPVAKGQAMPAYDPRALKGNGVTCASSPMGADHTAGNAFGARREVDPLGTEGQRDLTGSDYSVHLSSVHDLSRRASVGFVVQAVDVTALGDWAEYEKDIQSLIGEIRNSPCAQGIDRIFLPGEIEWLKWRERKQSGIPMPVKVLEQLQDLASELGVTVDLPLS
jgi:aldehyde:ferredoxin oxidoreductase